MRSKDSSEINSDLLGRAAKTVRASLVRKKKCSQSKRRKQGASKIKSGPSDPNAKAHAAAVVLFLGNGKVEKNNKRGAPRKLYTGNVALGKKRL